MAIVIGSADAPYRVIGLHGGEGDTFVKRLATGNQLFSDLDSFEYVRIPAGSHSGLHKHTRTEELFYVLSGRAELTLDDEVVEFGPGDLMLMSLDGRHAVRTIGDEALEMLVSEAYPREIVERLPAHAPAEG